MDKSTRSASAAPLFFNVKKSLVCFLTMLLLGAVGHPLQAQPSSFPTSTSPVGAIIAPSSPAASHDFGNNNPDVYVCLGDSITYGSALRSLADAYPARLQALLGKTVINEGIPGSRSYQGASRVGSVLNRYKPGYLLVLYGVNDIGERSNEAILHSLRQIVHSAKNNKTVPVIATLTPTFGGRGWKAPSVRDLNIRIRSLASEEGILLVDLEAVFAWDQSMFPDGLHPDSRGHERIAKAFYDALQASPAASSGGGCTFVAHGGFGLEWFLLFSVLFLKAAWGFFPPRRRKTPSIE